MPGVSHSFTSRREQTGSEWVATEAFLLCFWEQKCLRNAWGRKVLVEKSWRGSEEGHGGVKPHREGSGSTGGHGNPSCDAKMGALICLDSSETAIWLLHLLHKNSNWGSPPFWILRSGKEPKRFPVELWLSIPWLGNVSHFPNTRCHVYLIKKLSFVLKKSNQNQYNAISKTPQFPKVQKYFPSLKILEYIWHATRHVELHRHNVDEAFWFSLNLGPECFIFLQCYAPHKHYITIINNLEVQRQPGQQEILEFNGLLKVLYPVHLECGTHTSDCAVERKMFCSTTNVFSWPLNQ